MTREEAIMELNILFVQAPIVPNKRWGCKRNEALSMAIEALSKPNYETDTEAVKDCRTCVYGRYNDHIDKWVCYHSCKCNDFDLWESAEQTEYKLPGHDEVMEALDKMKLRGDKDE